MQESDQTAVAPGEGNPVCLLDSIVFDHLTQRSICELLAGMAENLTKPSAREDAAAVLSYFVEHLPRHICAEEEQLVPILKDHALPGDDLDAIIEPLQAGHRKCRLLAAGLRRDLVDLIGDKLPRDPVSFVKTAYAFCFAQAALVDWEDEKFIPYVESRLGITKLENAVRFDGLTLRRAGRRARAEDVKAASAGAVLPYSPS